MQCIIKYDDNNEQSDGLFGYYHRYVSHEIALK